VLLLLITTNKSKKKAVKSKEKQSTSTYILKELRGYKDQLLSLLIEYFASNRTVTDQKIKKLK
jgi:hypothetical protein